MLKRNKLILCTMVMAIIFAFAAPPDGVAGPEDGWPTEPNECMVIYGSGDDWFTIGISPDANDNWPQKTTCDGSGEAAKFLYRITGGNWFDIETTWYQTVPGQRPGSEQYVVNVGCSSPPVIEYIDPGRGASEVDCFAPFIGEEALIKSLWSSGDPLISHAANQWGANGWTSFVFKNESGVYYCRQYDAAGNPIGYGLPGPEIGDKNRIVMNVTKTISIDQGNGSSIGVTLVINETDCTFTAEQPNGQPYPQFPITELQVTSPGMGPAKVLEGWGSGKCDELTLAQSGSVCTDYCLGGWCIRIPYPCP